MWSLAVVPPPSLPGLPSPAQPQDLCATHPPPRALLGAGDIRCPSAQGHTQGMGPHPLSLMGFLTLCWPCSQALVFRGRRPEDKRVLDRVRGLRVSQGWTCPSSPRTTSVEGCQCRPRMVTAWAMASYPGVAGRLGSICPLLCPADMGRVTLCRPSWVLWGGGTASLTPLL